MLMERRYHIVVMPFYSIITFVTIAKAHTQYNYVILCFIYYEITPISNVMNCI